MASEDEEDDANSTYDDSFIDDCVNSTAASTQAEVGRIDMMAIYRFLFICSIIYVFCSIYSSIDDFQFPINFLSWLSFYCSLCSMFSFFSCGWKVSSPRGFLIVRIYFLTT